MPLANDQGCTAQNVPVCVAYTASHDIGKSRPDRRLRVRVLDADRLRFVTCGPLTADWCGRPQNTVLMPARAGILKTWKPAGARTAVCAQPWTCTT